MESSTIVQTPVLTARRVKNWYRCAWLVYLSGVILLPDVDESIGGRWSSCLQFKSYVSLVPCTISHEQINTVLFQTVAPEASMGKWSVPFREQKATVSCLSILRAESNCFLSIYFESRKQLFPVYLFCFFYHWRIVQKNCLLSIYKLYFEVS